MRGGREDELLNGFEDWAAGQGIDVDMFVVDVALDWQLEEKLDPGRWNADDIGELLLDWFPRKVTIPQPEWPRVLSTLHHWVDFLATSTELPHDPAALHSAIDQDAKGFLAAMADERNFGLAKFWATRMAEHGVDPEDGEQTRRFLDAVHVGEVEYDEDVLAEIMRRATDGAEDARAPLPPVVLPSEAELVALAENAALVTRLRTFAAWLGAGRPLTSTSRLRVADARELAGQLGVDQSFLERARSSAELPEVALLVEWAKAARLARPVKGRLVPVKSAAGLLDRPLELWLRAHSAFGRLGHAVCAPPSRFEPTSLLAEVLPELAIELALTLYTAGTTPVPVELLAQVTREVLADRFDFGDGGLLVSIRELMWRQDLARVFDALALLGAVELAVSDDPAELDKIAELSGEADPDPTLVRLTPLGLAAARDDLVAEGFVAPQIGDLVGEPLDQVCAALRHAAPELVESLLAGWVAARAPGDAAAESAAFIPDAPTAQDRMLGWAALDRTGAAGVEQARRLRAEGGVAGAVATEWLVRHGALAPESAREHEMLLALAESFCSLHELGLLIEELTAHTADEQLSFVRGLAHTDHPARDEMLRTIAARHPDRAVARAASASPSSRG
ncbi:hypothetical protein ACTG9Q_02850 [Actinokineospora sp. 24-640]